MRAFKPTTSLTKEQLTSLGVSAKDGSAQFTRPLFPVLVSKPVEIEKNVALDYKIVWQDDFRSRLYEMHSNPINAISDNYSIKIANALEKEQKQKMQFKFAYSQMPAELNIQNKKKLDNKTKPAIPAKKRKILRTENVEKELEILEQKENLQDDEEGSEKAANESDEDIENEGEVEDPELDDETDYHNNYFDNGENYFADEDDALDDGPIY